MDRRMVALVNGLRPSELALRDFIRPLMGSEVVDLIAGMDHGMRIEENAEAIRELLVVRRLPEELPWPPRQVLEPATYHEPDSDPHRRIARLFACLVIVRAGDAVEPATTLAALIESAVAHGPEATAQAVRYLAWCRLNDLPSWRDDPLVSPFLTLGLLVAYLMSPLGKQPELVAGLTAQVVGEVQAALAAEQPWWPERPSAKVLKRMGGSKGFRIWRSLIGRCDDAAIEPLRGWF
jgi:hypothetical protein